MDKINTVSIIGLGAIGSYIATSLQTVLGDNLRIIAGGERKTRIERDGVIANGKPFFFNVIEPEAKTDYADLAIIIPKFMGLRAAMADMKNQIGPDTIIIAPLNGVEAEEVVAEMYDANNILYSLMMVSVVMQGNISRFDPDVSYIQFGEKKNVELSPRVRMIKELFEKAGIHVNIPKDMVKAIWLKYMINVSENQTSAVLGLCYKAWNGCSPSADFVRHALGNEVVAVAHAKGIEITAENIKKHDELLKALIPTNKTSMLQDIEAKRPTEVEIFSGTMIHLGEKYGIPVPYNVLIYHCIKVLEEKNAGRFDT
ncbi:MAG: ketopantoate reductase family protein [Oscillospiraceae bacterium]